MLRQERRGAHVGYNIKHPPLTRWVCEDRARGALGPVGGSSIRDNSVSDIRACNLYENLAKAVKHDHPLPE
jgi:hypothetical protein